MNRLTDVPETISPHELTAIIEADVVPQFGESDGSRVRVDNYEQADKK
jgi:hypothetical protein